MAGSSIVLYNEFQHIPPAWDDFQKLIIGCMLDFPLILCYILIATLTLLSQNLTGLLYRFGPYTTHDFPMKRTTIHDLPREILLMIFASTQEEWYYDASSVCLALTCRSFYRVLKTRYPGPIDLALGPGLRIEGSEEDDGRKPCCAEITLADLLRFSSFIGIEFRLAHLDFGTVFLAKALYGVPGSLEERKLEERHADYRSVVYMDVKTGAFDNLFPSPWELAADDWYHKVDCILQRRERGLGPRQDLKITNELGEVCETCVGKSRVEDLAWLGFRQWSAMVGMILEDVEDERGPDL
ncbi:uncharacterized protein RAG0_10601 [Rhynchosporium agropyri]|uniref:Uncharacterized protein n=1 Tax=Rhynchosporium agropyri TaxID=914238 RepID=A0A1E1L0J0_9HELO|nr:uncharacterized protein RAG0_10601 [Rhynchosporium agropyri]